MRMTAEVTLYPFNADFLPPIRGFIALLNNVEGLRVDTFPTCTVISGEDTLVYDTLRDAGRWCREQHGQIAIVTKLLPGYEA